MLASLHVKNLALIDEEEIIFSKGLNILSGETGAGKSIILGALHLSLGDKASKDFLRDSDSEAFVEAVYLVNDEKTKEALRDLGVEPYDDEVIMSRKITESRSVGKINGEQVPAAKMKEVGDILLDIYGQKEHQSLLNTHKHMEFLDEFAKNQIGDLKYQVAESYKNYRALMQELEDAKKSDISKEREIVLLDHEINEIESANLKSGEDEELEDEYRRLSNFSKTMEYFQRAHEAMTGDGGASDALSSAISDLRHIESIDEKAADLLSMLNDADSIISDFNRELSSYMADTSFDAGRFNEVEVRLNEINRLKDKYGPSIEIILEELAARQEKKAKFESFDEYLSELKKNVENATAELDALSGKLSDIRHKAAKELAVKMQAAMSDLNFLNCEFDMELTRLDKYTDNGVDDGQFVISTNPGEPLRPLKDIASGGEMSRIMLAIKTVLASDGGIDTLIFDEIDAGISGRTAQAVSEKLSTVAANHQVICITHLPQIAAMADTHFLIEKSVANGHTISGIKKLLGDETVDELARMLGGSAITEAVMTNAKEMKDMAKSYKERA
ncbi:DNA repair protein RecN (Recombination protein N) [Pseudobutyrivibrio sp. 49]|uniref:DNA repair protein RecN n=1 Tax=unclassified Pseudobutyrivibrio TaxID=2638619 RepID=UPI000884B689|nr:MULTISPECIES: DNA repair protein RecN [unclassified Pseudobutyrivibrio]SDH78419.1 DNA repair protein RecN (Recombination protein N) [Pseudobutyrivibrio sp. 49]SFO01232.1 DNA repair protein RecN (Recombination protein N) [Pseudobutyrivibrio sp. UC1225]